MLSSEKSIEQLLTNLICVSKPYNALQNFKFVTQDTLQAEVFLENIESNENTIISCHETGRHLAILGSCVLALINPNKTKHYYLAKTALLQRASDSAEINFRNSNNRIKLIAQVKVIMIDTDKKIGESEGKIMTENGALIYTIKVKYQILKADLFQKLFRSKYTEYIDSKSINPYANKVELFDLKIADNKASANIGSIDSSKCIGHFDNFPALPIAILCRAMSALAVKYLMILFNNPNLIYTIISADVNADKLAFAGDKVFIEANNIGKRKNEFEFLITARNDSQLGKLNLLFRVNN